jgi:hypothetical protein
VAEKVLQTLKVDSRLNTKVTDEQGLPDGRHEITFSSGDKIVVDMCIPAFGVKPNSSFIPAKFLDAGGFVKVDEFFAVKGAEGVFAVGDVSNAEPPQFWFVEQQTKHIAKNVVLTLSDKSPLPYKPSSSGKWQIAIYFVFPLTSDPCSHDGSPNRQEGGNWTFREFQNPRFYRGYAPYNTFRGKSAKDCRRINALDPGAVRRLLISFLGSLASPYSFAQFGLDDLFLQALVETKAFGIPI